MSKTLRCPRLVVPAFVIALGAVVAASTPFSLAVTLSSTDSANAPAALTMASTLVDRNEGRVPSVYMNKSGQVIVDTRGSSSTVCFNFSDARAVVQPALAPRAGCYPVLLNTLITADTGTVGDLADGETRTYSMDIYWSGVGEDNRVHDYVLEFKRVLGSGIYATFAAGASVSENRWTIEPIGTGQVSVYRAGKGSGWSTVGTYGMPFHLTATRMTPSAR